MAILIPRKKEFWQRKPSVGQEVDWGNNLSEGLLIYQPLELSSTNEVRNLAGEHGGYIDPDVNITEEGLSYSGAYTSNDIAYATQTPPTGGSFTLITRALTTYVPSGDIYPNIVSTRDAGNNRFALFLDGNEADAAKTVMALQNNVGTAIKAKLPKPPTDEFVVYGATYDDLGDRQARLQISTENAVAVSAALTGTLEPYNNEGIYLGNRRAGGRQWDGVISDFYFFNVAKSNEEVRSLVDAPYQILKPRKKYWVLPTAAATTTLNNDLISAMHFQRHYEPIAMGE